MVDAKNMQTPEKRQTAWWERFDQWSVLYLLGLLAVCAILFLPMVYAPYGNVYYGVRGVDLILGSTLPGEAGSIIPQTSFVFGIILTAVSFLITLLMRNRAKSIFLGGFLNLVMLVLYCIQFFSYDRGAAKFDPIIEAFHQKRITIWFYMLLIVIALLIVISVVRIAKNGLLKRDFKLNYSLYIMAIPIMIYMLVFMYYPMYGVIVAFKDFSPALGILGSPWAGFHHFKDFFNSIFFERVVGNTLMLSAYSILFGFTAPIVFALLLNEVRGNKFKRAVQTVTYMPHFISLVVICGLILDFFSTDGLINGMLSTLGVPKEKVVNYMNHASYYRRIYIGSDIWQNVGWGSIIYLAALSGIDPALYEAATIDGAGRWRRLLNITLPSLKTVIMIQLIVRLGNVMSIGHEKTILLYNQQIYDTADIISSLVYRKGLVEMNYSFSTAVGLFNSVINMFLLFIANSFSAKVSEVSLW